MVQMTKTVVQSRSLGSRSLHHTSEADFYFPFAYSRHAYTSFEAQIAPLAS